jgi:phage gp29-like protein
VQMYDMIGLLEKAAPYTILKRHSWGSWDEFEELFGVPIRIAKLATQNESVKNEVAGWLKEMGSAPYAVFPLGTEIEIKENTKTDAFNVFYMKLQELNRELSKLVLHQTMTTDNGSSKSQGSVHENTLHEIIFADEKKALSILNDKLVPAMRNNGYAIPDGYRIKVTETKDPNSQIKIDTEFLKAGYILPKNYIEETYGTEIETMPNASANPDPAKKP